MDTFPYKKTELFQKSGFKSKPPKKPGNTPLSGTYLSFLDIIYDAGADLYNMRFYRRTFSKKTFESRTKDIAIHEGIYFDMLEEMFTMVTGLYTRF